jgi:uncharacterized membrane protein
VPWFGVLAAGYGFGPLLLGDPRQRRRRLAALGLALTAAFVALRAANGYGDPHPWAPQATPLLTACSFLGATMYPPSLQAVLMTLGPAVFALAVFDRPPGPVGRAFVTFGRVPLFFYLIHFPFIHALAVAWSLARYGTAAWLFDNFQEGRPDGFGLDLPGLYLLWLAVVVVLYSPCRWFADLKRRRKDWWLRYL